MWEKARETDAASPRFDRALYEDLRRKGILLGDFLHRQLTNLRAWRPDAVDSGLVLDLLEFYTTPLGSARRRSAARASSPRRMDTSARTCRRCCSGATICTC